MEKYVISLLLTATVECSAAAVLTRNKAWTVYVFLLNLLTNPLANLIYNGALPLLAGNGKVVLIALIETAVVLGEWALFASYRKTERKGLKRMSMPKCFIYALATNMLSYFAGFALGKLIG